MAWRDEATLAAMALVHASSACAMQALDVCINALSASDAMTGADAAARGIIRPLMRAEVGARADDWFNAQARALRKIDARLEAIALGFAAMAERPGLPPDEVTAGKGWVAPAWLRESLGSISSTIEQAATAAANHALPVIVRDRADQVSAEITRQIGMRSGAHERLRIAARGELVRTWLGPSTADATQRPYLTHLLDYVDRTSGRAMEIIS